MLTALRVRVVSDSCGPLLRELYVLTASSTRNLGGRNGTRAELRTDGGESETERRKNRTNTIGRSLGVHLQRNQRAALGGAKPFGQCDRSLVASGVPADNRGAVRVCRQVLVAGAKMHER